MRSVSSLMLLAACGFEATLTPDGNINPTDAKPAAGDAAPGMPGMPGMPDAPPAKVCAASYVAVPAAQTASTYRRVQVLTGWLAAKANCAADGGQLVVPETRAEAMAIHAFVDPLDISPYFWAGISDPERDGQWITVTGAPFRVLDWGANDPDRRPGEIYARVDEDGNFYDWFDYRFQEYACECTP